jgi:hypothetical protein
VPHLSQKGRAFPGLDPESATPDLMGGAGWGSTRSHNDPQVPPRAEPPTRQHLLRSAAHTVYLPLAGGGREPPRPAIEPYATVTHAMWVEFPDWPKDKEKARSLGRSVRGT